MCEGVFGNKKYICKYVLLFYTNFTLKNNFNRIKYIILTLQKQKGEGAL